MRGVPWGKRQAEVSTYFNGGMKHANPCALIIFIATSTSLLVAGNLTLVSEYVNIQKLNLTVPCAIYALPSTNSNLHCGRPASETQKLTEV